ncbi:hypothetical protein M1N64_01410 [Peptococcaceae bacterium]|nr:hypothetical protein [Peptococcaceae bacterium]
MPAISKIRLTNVQYEQGDKRYNDELFLFDGHNGAIILENGGGKTVLIQTVIQAMLPNGELAGRKLWDTLDVSGSPAHIAVEWILENKPRRYALTAITFYMGKDGLEYFMYAYDYSPGDQGRIEALPLVISASSGKRPAGQEEIREYYQKRAAASMNARYFSGKQDYQSYIEEQFQIVATEWQAIIKINSNEGGVESFFDNCKTTVQLADRLLIPIVEQGMSGQGTKHFAKVFDNLRQQFREYLDLNEQVKEYQQLTTKIDQVIEQYALLDEQELDYRLLQAQAKGLWQKSSAEKQDAQVEGQDISATEQDWQQAERHWQQKESSLELATAASKLEQLNSILNQLNIIKEQQQQRYDRYHHQLESLEHARLQKGLKEKQETLRHLQEQLTSLDRSPDIGQLKTEQQHCLAGIKFHYDQTEADLTQRKNQVKDQQEKYQEQLAENKTLTEQKQQQLQALKISQAESQTELKSTKKQMQEIEQSILDNPAEETVPVQLKQWENRSEHIETELHQLFKRQADNKTARETLILQLKVARENLNKATGLASESKTKLAAIDRAAGQLLDRLQVLLPLEPHFNNIYRRQSTIESCLKGELALCQSRREKLLATERVLLHFYDLYQNNEVFTADPALERWIIANQSDFPDLQTGSAFLEIYLEERGHTGPSLTDRSGTECPQLEDIYQRYPFWPLAVIAGAASAGAVQTRLEKLAESITHPVLLLTRQEALDKIEQLPSENWAKNEELATRNEKQQLRTAILDPQTSLRSLCTALVTPTNWPAITAKADFKQWLQEQQRKAAETTAGRQQSDKLCEIWHGLTTEMTSFWQQYPYQEIYQSLQAKYAQAQQEQQQLKNEITVGESESTALEQQQLDMEKRRKTLEDERDNLSERQRAGLKWHSLASEKQQLIIKLAEIQAGQVPLEQELARLETAVGQLIKQIDRQREKTAEINKLLIEVRAEPVYLKVRQITAISSEQALATLKNKLDTLQDRLNGIQQNRQMLERQQESQHQEITGLEQQIDRQLKKWMMIIDQEVSFPPDGEVEINRLIALRQEAEQALKTISLKVQQADKDQAAQKGRLDTLQEGYTAKFGAGVAIVCFSGQDLTKVEQTLQGEKEKLAKEKNFLNQRKQAWQQLEQKLAVVERALEMADVQYRFRQESVVAAPLSLKDEQQYPYGRLKFAQVLLEKLATGQKKVERQQKEVANKQKQFEQYCTSELKDEKTKQQSLEGIRLKVTYREIKAWGEQLQERIRSAVVIIEAEMRTHDEAMQNFIAYLHAHLTRICEELSTIPKMTAVKVGDSKKEIYSFTVPTWDEQAGLTKLRRHLEWMITRLAGEQFLTGQGLEDSAKIKKQIENWLHPKQLLQIVNSGQEIKVRCRKVNSESHISSNFVDWPKTEKWSAGEKWSKNMTLFLGLLNYLAEKRHHIRREAVNHRVVILDNPFGKASSEHVLAPVFFIADQLGFQLLALTAHAEGKFLKDHFPVIYSCRLRQTKDPSVSIMTKEQVIKQAYFKDHDPFEIQRLGAEEQMELF